MGTINNSVIKIEIDGIEFNVKQGSKIIEIADDAGIYIPRFCYHKKLSIAANCRMCLVEVEKAPKLFPACATPVANGMKIFTNTEKVIDAQRSVMEFLLINHPLDCPICDQGGECELQDLTIGYGCSTSRFLEKKRAFEDYDLGPLVSTDVTRCILCSRCVRFCEEIAGTKEIGIINRGSNSRIFTFLKNHLTSEISGNIIDLCPVGALTAKPSRFKFRAWELIQNSSISHHDCIGSNIYVHVFRDKIIRIVPRRNESLNESWISDRDRFSYEGLYSKDRINHPMIKKNGKWFDISWTEAISYSCQKLQNIKNKYGANQVAALASPNSTVEELFILQKLIRSLGSNNLDHRLKQLDFSNQEYFPKILGLEIDLNQIDDFDCVFVIGSDLAKEQPIIALKLRKIIKKNGKVFLLNPCDFNLNMDVSEKYITNPKNFTQILMQIIKNFEDKSNNKFNKIDKLFENVKINKNYSTIIDALLSSKNKLILLGSYSYTSPDFTKIISLSKLLSDISNSKYGIMTEGSNTAGAWLTGFIPHRLPGFKNITNNKGLNALDIFQKNLKSYILFGLEIENDSLYPNVCIQALKNSELNIAFSSFKSNTLLDTADIILPIASSYENTGTFINISGLWQSFSAVVPAGYEVKLGWNILCEIGKYLKLPGLDYNNTTSILKEIKSLINNESMFSWKEMKQENFETNISGNIIIVPYISQYDIDPLVRRAHSLQKIEKKTLNTLKCNKFTYKSLDIDKYKTSFSIFIDETISNNSIFIENYNIINYSNFKFPYEAINMDNL